MKFKCPECGSFEIHCTAFVHANTWKILQAGADGPRDEFYCASCGYSARRTRKALFENSKDQDDGRVMCRKDERGHWRPV